ncbi:hypothetical protein [Neorhizobium tomejilense]|uniref:hypothetical protein n=1 Tax=Neorhizobium tomejilense TaxID=2093828 RepID=UPI003ECFCF68
MTRILLILVVTLASFGPVRAGDAKVEAWAKEASMKVGTASSFLPFICRKR